MVEYLDVIEGKLQSTTDSNANIAVYYEPSEVELDSLSNMYNIDNYTIRSCLDNDEIPRIEVEDEYSLLILKRPKGSSPSENTIFKVNTVGIFIVKDKMIFLMKENLHILDSKSLAGKVHTIVDIMLKFIYSTVSHFIDHLKVINMITETFEKNLTDTIDNKFLVYMYNLKKSLVYYIAGINENSIFFDKLKSLSVKFNFSSDNNDMLTSIIIENNQARKLSVIFSNIIDVIISAQEAVTNNRLNKTMKRLTIITTIFMPLSLLAGIAGMSEWTAFTGGEANMAISYPIFFLILTIIGIVMYLIFKWKGWT